MTIANVSSWLLSGLFAGLVIRFLLPGRQAMSLSLTIILAVAGALVGGLICYLTQAVPSEPFSTDGGAWHGWVVAFFGGVIAVWVYPILFPRRGWRS